MPAFKSLVERRFGKLLVLYRVDNIKVGRESRIAYMCECDCGTRKIIVARQLSCGDALSCGCSQYSEAHYFKHGHCSIEYNKRSAEHKTWHDMKARCLNSKLKNYHLYGGRGITVCNRWRDSFQNFLDDMGIRPSPKHSLDRFPDMNGNYEPGNCRWATKAEQAHNMRSNKWLECSGKIMIVADWCKELHCAPITLRRHLKKHGTNFCETIKQMKNDTAKSKGIISKSSH